VTLVGQPELTARDLHVPADISSAAFPLVAALLVPGSEVKLPEIGINPLRAGLVETLREMGADLQLANERTIAGEPVADLIVHGAGPLNGIEVPAERAPRMIDEYPVLAIAASCARGTTRFRGLSELRVKESDRLSAIARGLAACGVKVAIEGDDLTIEGTGRPPRGGVRIESELDHRIAMSFLVLGLAAQEPVAVDDGSPIETSFPVFETLMNGLGARIGAA
jgi:3-phosphoshikimate 1-carboxyvinyltransferase